MKDLPALPKDTSLRSATPLDYGVLNLSFQGVRAIVFDLDGTLIDYRYHAETAREKMIGELRRLNFDVSSMSPQQPTQIIMDEAYAQIGKGFSKISRESLKERLYRMLDTFDMEAYASSDIKPHSLPVVKELKEKGYLLGLFTNSGSRTVKITLERYQIGRYFDAVVTRDDIEQMKPSGEGLKKILGLLNAEPSEAVYVGDSWADIAAARESKVRVIAVEGGVSTREHLQEQSPELILTSLETLPSLLPMIGPRAN